MKGEREEKGRAVLRWRRSKSQTPLAGGQKTWVAECAGGGVGGVGGGGGRGSVLPPPLCCCAAEFQ